SLMEGPRTTETTGGPGPAAVPAGRGGWSRLAAWVRADVRRPEWPVPRSELVLQAVGAVIIVGVAQWTDPGTAREGLAAAPAAVAFVAGGLLPAVPTEVFAALTTVLVMLAIGPDGDLEIVFFLLVLTTLYAAWHQDSLVRAGGVFLVGAVTPWFVAAVLAPDA